MRIIICCWLVLIQHKFDCDLPLSVAKANNKSDLVFNDKDCSKKARDLPLVSPLFRCHHIHTKQIHEIIDASILE